MRDNDDRTAVAENSVRLLSLPHCGFRTAGCEAQTRTVVDWSLFLNLCLAFYIDVYIYYPGSWYITCAFYSYRRSDW